MVDVVLRPIVRRPREDAVDLCGLPLETDLGTLMLVDRTEGVAELVDDDTAVLLVDGVVAQPAEVHRGLVLRKIASDERIGTHCGPRTRVGAKRDPDLFVVRPHELERDVRELLPDVRLLLHLPSLHRAAVQEPALQRRAVWPLLDGEDRKAGDWVADVRDSQLRAASGRPHRLLYGRTLGLGACRVQFVGNDPVEAETKVFPHVRAPLSTLGLRPPDARKRNDRTPVVGEVQSRRVGTRATSTSS